MPYRPKTQHSITASGLIETEESVFGFPSLFEYATIAYAHRDHI